MKKTFLLIVAMMVLLTICSCKKEEKGLLTEVNDVEVKDFSVEICGAVITNKDLEKCKLYSGVSDTTNSEGNKKSNVFVGYKLSDVLLAAQIEGNFFVSTITCLDGYSMTYEGNLNDEGILLAISKDGKPFKDGPWFAPLTSDTTGDFAQDLSKIEIDNITSPLANKKEGDKNDETKEIEFPQDPIVEDKTDKINFGSYSFKINGKEVKNSDLEGLRIYRITVVTKNSKGVVSQNKYSGYVLKDVLSRLGISGKSVKTIASDNYESIFTEEMLNDELTIIAIEKDKNIGENGTIWVAPCSQNTSGKYAKGVVEIIVE